MRKQIVAGNWKMNLTLEEGQILTSEVVNMVKDEVDSRVEIALCPPFIHLATVSKLIGAIPNVKLGAQNVHQESAGAYTGEVSASMLQSVGTHYVLIGHSERREYFHEGDALLAQKLDAVLAAGMTPLFCCGEPLDIREAGTQNAYVSAQLTNSLFHLDAETMQKVVIAYEPIWAIGTGKTASAAQAQEMHAHLRAHLAGQYGQAVADQVSILYGGSVKPANAAEIFGGADVDGGLIGGASLKSRDFTDIAKAIQL